MGICSLKSNKDEPIIGLSKKMFAFHSPVGKGGFSKVWRVTFKRNKQVYAMKVMLKARVALKKSINSVLNERKLLSILRHPFLINMQYAFQDQSNLYLVLEYMPGGDLRFFMTKTSRFTEEQSRFIIACLLVSLSYLHSEGIIHRDVKPENLVFDQDGYLRLTDLGVARVWTPENFTETSGTPGYMAPEILCRQNHAFVSDLYSVGVILYEFIMGNRPYCGKNRQEIRQSVLAKQVQIKKEFNKNLWSRHAIDLCNKLIQRKPDNRLGKGGISEVIQHKWFDGFNWNRLLQKQMEAPFKPKGSENVDQYHINSEWRDKKLIENVKREQYEGLFPEYFYDVDSSN